jgi:hypothetical protein
MAGDGTVTATALERAAQDYIAIRRSFGFKLIGHDRLLADFCGCWTGPGWTR